MDRQLPQRKILRLQGYDYALAGGYFVTVAAHQHGNIFGLIEGEEVVLNDIGKMVCECWLETPQRYLLVQLDEFILMPDHFHAVLFITEPNVGVGLDPTRSDEKDRLPERRATSRVAPTLGQIIGAFKSISTRRYFSGIKENNWPELAGKLWQRGYHDRIIRNENELHHNRKYVAHNAIKQEKQISNPI